jgi:hypothetical protein
VKLRDVVTIALLCLLIASAYAFVQQADEEAAQRDQVVWAGKADK